MILHQVPYMRMQHDPSLDLLRMEWEPGSSMRAFRATALAHIEVARELKVRRSILAMDSLPDIPVYDQLWLSTHYIPKVIDLPLERVVFAISAARLHNQLAVEALVHLARPFIRFDIQFFRQFEPGLRWLTDDSPLLPGLLAEWNDEFNAPAPGVAEPRARYAAASDLLLD